MVELSRSQRGLLSFITGSKIGGFDIHIAFNQEIDQASLTRKMFPEINIQNLKFPNFEYSNNKDMIVSGNNIKIEKIDLSKEPYFQSAQQVDIHNITINGFKIISKKK